MPCSTMLLLTAGAAHLHALNAHSLALYFFLVFCFCFFGGVFSFQGVHSPEHEFWAQTVASTCSQALAAKMVVVSSIRGAHC
jgi:hypothetical protein